MNSLISVNVGLPRDVEWQGRVVRTAIWKQPVGGRVMARRLNLDGDGQGDLSGHGGEYRAVMVYQLESYRYWERYLQRHGFAYGQFGENFTVEGLADNEVCIGDRYRIGDAVIEVTQPRVTCYRVGIRMSDPRMAALLVSHHRPGLYLRVIEEGDVGMGDVIEKLAEGPERITVAEIDGLLYLPGHPRDDLQRALRIPSLSLGWKKSLEALAGQETTEQAGGNAGLAPSSPPPAWQGFRSLRVSAIVQETADVKSFFFESEDRLPLPAPLAGQFLVFKLELVKEKPPLLRSYSISGPPGGGSYRISVKRAEGQGSTFMHDRIRVGDLLPVSAPRGNFTLAAGTGPVVLMSAGIGATPVLSMPHSLRANTNSAREIWWLYGTRNRNQHPFASEVRALVEGLPDAHTLIAYSDPGEGDRPGLDYDIKGHLTISALDRWRIPQHGEFYLCGPPSFMTELTAALVSSGVSPSSSHSETFGAGAAITPGIANAVARPVHPPTGPPGTGLPVSFTRSGLTVSWNPRFQSLLEFAEACDVPVRWSCRTGVCHMCESGLIDGRVRYAPEPLD